MAIARPTRTRAQKAAGMSVAQSRAANAGNSGMDIISDPVTGNAYSRAPGGTYSPYTAPKTSITSSSGTSRKEEKKLGADITATSAPSYAAPSRDPNYLNNIDREIQGLSAVEQANINSKFNVLDEGFKGKQDKEVGTTSAGLARIGGYLGDSGSGTGVLLNLSKSHRAELADLESKRQEALFTARKFYTEKKYDLAKEKNAEAKSYEQETYKRQQEYFQGQRQIAADARAAGITPVTQQSIYEAIKNGAQTTDDIFKALDGKVSAEDIAGFIAKVKPKGIKDAPFEFDANDIVLLLGSGMGQDDITEVEEFVNENGYTDEFRKTLTASERRILDSIYYPKPVAVGGAGTGVGGTLTIAEAKSLGLPTSLIGRNQNQVIADLNNPAPPPWFFEYVQSGFADQSIDPTPEGVQPMWQTFRAEVLGQNSIGARKTSGSSSSSSGGGLTFEELQK